MMHWAWSSIVEVPYCFSRSYVKFQGHMALKIVEFDPNWAFPDCNSSLNSPMAMKCCTKLETAKERCPIVFQGHPSNFKVTRYKTSPILTQIGHFRTIGRSQLSNPSDLPCYLADQERISPQKKTKNINICFHKNFIILRYIVYFIGAFDNKSLPFLGVTPRLVTSNNGDQWLALVSQGGNLLNCFAFVFFRFRVK